MSICRLLYLEAGHLASFAWKRGQLTPEGSFPADPKGIRDFSEYLLRHKQDCFQLLSNLADEEYAIENIPQLWGAERQAMIARKTRQHFPEPALCKVISLGREKTTRRNEKLLITALTLPEEHLQPWLDTIAKAEAPLKGIYSTAQLYGKLLKRLGQTTHHCLVLNQFTNAIRESYLCDGQTIFSRLVAINDTSPPAIAGRFVNEAEKLYQYMISQRQIEREDNLPTFLIAHPEVIAAIGEIADQARHPPFTIIDIHAATHRVKLKASAKDGCCQQLFLHLLATDTPRHQFAAHALRLDFHLRQARRLIWGLSLGIAAGASLNAAQDIRLAGQLAEETQALDKEHLSLVQRQKETLNKLPRLGITPAKSHQLIAYQAELAHQQGRLALWFMTLGQALDQASDIELESLDWQIDALHAATRKETVMLNGFVQGEKAVSPGLAQVALGQFSALLRANPNYSVEIVSPPKSSPGSYPLAVEDDESEEQTRQQFSLRITFPQ